LRSRTVWMMASILVLVMVMISPPAFSRPLASGPAVGGFLLTEQNPTEEDSAASQLEKTKNPTGALLRSLALPGWGQLYNEQYLKCGLVLLAEGLLIGGTIVEHGRAENDHSVYQDLSLGDEVREAAWRRYSRRIDKRNTYLWYLAGAKFLSMVDAYVDAHLYRFDEGPFAVDVEAWPGARVEMCLVIRYKMW
jgi:hypothetical protein